LFVAPFAEEMNKARRMVALQSRAFAAIGWTVLQMDLFGCGDSDGDFAEADWSQWQADIADATRWLLDETGHLPMLWGLRAGCLLASEAARVMNLPPQLLMWQPTVSGRQMLRQFLRLRLAGDILNTAAHAKGGTQDLHERLVRGECVEVAGYMLSPGVAIGLDKAELVPPAIATRATWIDVTAAATTDPSHAARSCIESWQSAGHHVTWRSVCGPAFWQTQEISECQALIDATLRAVGEPST
jgi:exosortase A-associated hydrolase 2